MSTEGEENETEPPNICPHLFWGRDGKGSRLDSGSPMAWLVMAPVFSCGHVAEGRSTGPKQFDGVPRHGPNL